MGSSRLVEASEVLKVPGAGIRAGKIQVCYSIHYSASVKVAGSSLSEGRDELTLGSLPRVALAGGRSPMRNVLLSSVFFFLNI